ncbi:MAG TPA: SDR family oxidoreductase [Candidatus Binatia bacterium]|jgi:NAD(P)-dependent dehydrogenase (short-subunit alcohol dehydrogenase family)|nr:SDR family oxidoreductase [Candidatus Binatia bacterium]
MLLKNRIALVTGSTHNIGLGIARAFAREGAKVIVHSRHEEDAKKIAGEIRGDYFVADVAQPEQVAALFDHIIKQHGRLDILVNSVAHSTSGGVLEVSLDEWNRIMTINLTGYFLCIQHAGKIMKEKGGGAIINISAGSGERSSPGGAAYSVSKGAINSLTRQAAVDLAPYIRVNGIISGLVGTPIGQKDMGSRKPEYDMIPLRRIGQPEDVTEAAVFLASDKASYITNTILPVDGGRLNAMTGASFR